MSRNENKTRASGDSVERFLAGVEDADRQADCRALVSLMSEVTGEPPRMWGDRMVGFGRYHYRYPSGREGDWMLTGFSPRKRDLTVYVMAGLERYPELMERLGKHKTGKSCLYLKRLSGVDMEVLRELVRASVEHVRWTYPD